MEIHAIERIVAPGKARLTCSLVAIIQVIHQADGWRGRSCLRLPRPAVARPNGRELVFGLNNSGSPIAVADGFRTTPPMTQRLACEDPKLRASSVGGATAERLLVRAAVLGGACGEGFGERGASC